MGTTKKAKAVADKPEVVTSFKGFDSDLRCQGFQFEVGKTYSVEGKVVVCQRGFHAVDADNPLHVWDFYPPVGADGKYTRYAEVEQSGAMDRAKSEQGTKIASASVTIKAELSLPDFIRRAIEVLTKAAKGTETAASGNYAKLAASGDSAKLAASGNSATLAASGNSAKLAASGNSATLAASGYSATLAASGNYAKLAASGNSATLAASGKDSVIASSSRGGCVSGADGTWLSQAEYDRDGKCVGFATGCVGKGGIKADTWYRAEGGKLVEAA